MRISSGKNPIACFCAPLLVLAFWAGPAMAQAGIVLVQSEQTGSETSGSSFESIEDLLNGADLGVGSIDLLAALEGAAAAGQPIAAWRLGLMYESGDGVKKDLGRAFAYFSQVANENADKRPRSLDSDIVAQSFIKVGDYYLNGVPDAGIKPDRKRSYALLTHAASYFGDADAQYRLGHLYLTDEELGISPIQSARWLTLAAQKGHVRAQATLGDLLFTGAGVTEAPVEGLMWLRIAQAGAIGTPEEEWVSDLATRDMLIATPAQRAAAMAAADEYLIVR